MGVLYIDNIFCSFRELYERFNPRSHLFRYFEVRDFAKLHNISFPKAIPNSLIDTILDIPINGKRLISKIYTLISKHTAISVDKIEKDWEYELGKVIEDGIWEDAYTIYSCASYLFHKF